MKLSLVIPVWNDLPGLDRLLRQVSELGVFAEIFVVDDASDEPAGPSTVPAAAAVADRLTWLRSAQRRGAGHARNLALERVSGDHVIFFDSDDLFTKDFPAIVALAAAETRPFDFLMFRHHDSRVLQNGGSGMLHDDEARWQRACVDRAPKDGTQKQGTIVVPPGPAQILARVSAYPWNKIYRTEFLRSQRIRCTETMVHNDVELHWTSFIMARRILATTMTGATHFVSTGGMRLTNRRNAERLEVFRSFENVLTRLRTAPTAERLGFLHPFTRFASDLLSWVRNNIDAEHHHELRRRTRAFYLSGMNPDWMRLIAFRDPALARRINRSIIEEGLS
ncbi:glycosyltransferase [Paracoccus kondratievae]|uniref:Glycosyltransferase 2-like domain-containing protein n=1 Tax=Paracoccus kondratievae TaxID=135740 RepID=A0AAD3NTX0_9RHOB|nr:MULTISPECIES: glycosyltransferase [Paracoccus]QFQ87743.1 glycosyltransferase [Paracoccus kondratievae]GLK63176.1 hypothetical protein GCM10017635_06450 [Paracoccus kondratievae]SMG51704.1 Glycosyl transferase family 2 [Paracoccus sp. J56]